MSDIGDMPLDKVHIYDMGEIQRYVPLSGQRGKVGNVAYIAYITFTLTYPTIQTKIPSYPLIL